MSSHRTLISNRNHRFTALCVLVVPFLIVLPHSMVKCQFVNRPPHFVPGSGDMARFSLSENTPIDSPVYQLRGKEMEPGKGIREFVFGFGRSGRNPGGKLTTRN